MTVSPHSTPRPLPLDPVLRERDERLESLKALLGRLAHDFNNFLVPMLGYVSLLKEEVPADSTALQYATILEAAAKRTEQFIESMQLAVRPQRHFSPKETDFTSLLSMAVSSWMASLPGGAEIAVIQTAEPCALTVDEVMWTKAFQQILSNARFALVLGGKLEINLAMQTLSPGEMLDLNIQQARVCRLAFRDNGFGMGEAILKRACEPFFTTRSSQKCLGLGLTIVHSVALAHGGQMRLESAEDAGTTVTLWIPAVNPPADAPRKPAPVPLPVASAPRPKPKPGGKILLVEDDAMVREVIKSHLQKSHLEVLTACDGEEGLKMFRKHGPDIALVVTDITMPKMDGIALCQAVKTLDPKARVILISGDMEAMRESSLAALGPQRPMLIRKPFNFKTFVGTLQSQLDGPGNGAAE